VPRTQKENLKYVGTEEVLGCGTHWETWTSLQKAETALKEREGNLESGKDHSKVREKGGFLCHHSSGIKKKTWLGKAVERIGC